MNFSLRYSLFLLTILSTFCVAVSEPDKHLNCTASNTHNECPANAICSAVNEAAKNFQCTCLPNYIWNPLWQQVISVNNANTTNKNNNNNNSNSINANNNSNSNSISNQFSILSSANVSAYCLNVEATNATETANGKVYERQPAKVEDLAFGILIALFVAIIAIILVYLLKVSRPIKRSKAFYTQLRRRHENRERLEEFSDDISMIEMEMTEKR